MKRILSSILALAMVYTMVQVGIVTASAYQSGDFEYQAGNDFIEITGYTGSSSNVIIPSEINGLSVTQISYDAFNGCTFTSIFLPSTIDHINSYTSEPPFFGCSTLTEINVDSSNQTYLSINGVLFNKSGTILLCYPKGRQGVYSIPYGVNEIGILAFSSCEGLTGITIPNSVVTINDYAFKETILSNVTIPDSVIEIGCGAFSWSALTSATIPNNVETICDEAFIHCSSLTSVVIEGKVTIGYQAFSYCPNLTDVTIGSALVIDRQAFNQCYPIHITIGAEVTADLSCFKSDIRLVDFIVNPDNTVYSSQNGILFNKDGTTLIEYPGTKTGAYTVPNGVEKIDSKAFSDCAGLTGITVPNSVKSIGEFAFSGTPWFNNYSGDFVIINNILIWYKGTALVVTIPNNVTIIGDAAFYNRPLTSVIIPSNVETIGSKAFYYCFGLTSVTMSDSVRSIGDSAFYYCPALSSINIPANIDNIEPYLFYNCTSLTSISLPNGIKTIGKSAFQSCTGLQSVSIPSSVSTIDAFAFSHCTSLASMSLPDNLETIGDSAFDHCTNLSSTMLPDNLETIGDSAFDYCTNLASITLPDNLITIGDSAFSDCTDLTSISIPGGVENIGKYVFQRSGLTSATIGCGITTISEGMFLDCPLSVINMPNNIIDIGDYAFAFCHLTSITIPSSTLNIGKWAFAYCLLSSLFVYSDNLKIGEGAFGYCSSLENAYFFGDAPTLENDALDAYIYYFSGKSGYAELNHYKVCVKITGTNTAEFAYGYGEYFNFPSEFGGYTITSIGDYAFNNRIINYCDNITIPDTITRIGKYAFANCSMFNLTIPNSVTNIDDYAFYGCGNLSSVDIPSSVTNIGYKAFGGSYGGINVDTNNMYYSSQDGILFNKTKTILIQYSYQGSGVYQIPSSVNQLSDGAFNTSQGLTTIIIPSGLTDIGRCPFQYCVQLSEINVDNNNQSYSSQDGVLYNKAKTTLVRCPIAGPAEFTIPNTVTRIGDDAFYDCYGLSDISIPDTVTVISNEAFDYCSQLSHITIPASVSSIGNYAFDYCTQLTNAYFLGNAPTLGSNVFDNCASTFKAYYTNGNTTFTNPWNGYATSTNMEAAPTTPVDGDVTVTITYPADANTKQYKIGSGNWLTYTAPVVVSANDTVYARYTDQYNNTNSIGSITVSNIVHPGDFTYTVTNSAAQITGYTGAGGNVTLPSELGGYPVTAVSAQVFENKTTLHYVTIPDSITSIGDNAFNGCSNLSVINIGSGLNPENDFMGECTGLAYVNIASENPNLSSRDGVIYDKAGTTLLMCPIGRTGTYQIPSGVTSIAVGAFYCCNGLTGVTNPSNSITSIGEAAFYGCTQLTSALLPANLESIGDGAYYGCTGLQSITIPSKLKNISPSAFFGCTGLTNVTIPEGILGIGANAFSNCTGLITANIPASVNSISENVFAGCSSLTNINVDADNEIFCDQNGVLFNKIGTVLISYPAGKGNTYDIPNGVTEIASAFTTCASLTNVTIPSTVTRIDPLAFYQCTGLTNVILPDSVTYIGYWAFSGCTGLTTITLPENVNSIDTEAFKGCTSLTGAYFEGNAPTTMGSNVFSNCASGFTVYYHSTSTGFTNPWHGYTTATY